MEKNGTTLKVTRLASGNVKFYIKSSLSNIKYVLNNYRDYQGDTVNGLLVSGFSHKLPEEFIKGCSHIINTPILDEDLELALKDLTSHLTKEIKSNGKNQIQNVY